MFHPVSAIAYNVLDENGQVLVCSLDGQSDDSALTGKWAKRACAIFPFHAEDDVMSVVRDLLANPQIRTIVFDGEGKGREAIKTFWQQPAPDDHSIRKDHIELAQRFVDLYDGDCWCKAPMQPFWPERIKYLEEA